MPLLNRHPLMNGLLRVATRRAEKANDTATLANIALIESTDENFGLFRSGVLLGTDDDSGHPIRDAIAAAIAYYVANPEALVALIKMIAELIAALT